jgi:hypothetical protein
MRNLRGHCRQVLPAGREAPGLLPGAGTIQAHREGQLSDANVNDPVRKIGYIDLMQIADPNTKAKKPLNDTVLTFPFFTIENVDVVDERHIVGNDNNLPFSSSREPDKQDDNEFVLLDVADLLKAR